MIQRKSRFPTQLLLAALLGAAPAMAHDEGHGPKLTDQGLQGGIVSPVLEEKDANKGAKATVLHKAELVRSEDGTVRIFVYDTAMKPFDSSGLDKTAAGKVVYRGRKLKGTSDAVELKMEGAAYVGKMGKPKGKPFDLEVAFGGGGKKLFVAFSNLD